MKKKIIEKRITKVMGTVDPRLMKIMRDYASYLDLTRIGYPKDSILMKNMYKDIKETIKTIGN